MNAALYLNRVAQAVMVFLTCLLLCHCVQRSKQEAKVVWYIASKSPLTYCPKGHRLPAQGTLAAEYVYLGDRKTRFYIPPGRLLHRQQALELRALSKPKNHHYAGESPTVEDTIRWVYKAVYRTTVTGIVLAGMMVGGGAPADGSIADQLLEAAWED